METNNEYLTIAEFANLIGVSKQAVYKRLKDNEISKYCKVIDGKQCIAQEAMSLFGVAQPAKRQKQEHTVPGAEETRVENVDFLLEQIREKDALILNQQSTIERQVVQLKELQTHIMEQSTTLAKMLDKQMKLQENYQILIAQQQRLTADSSTGQKQDIQPVEQPNNQVEQPVVQPIQPVDNGGEYPVEEPIYPEKPKTENFIRRFFHRWNK